MTRKISRPLLQLIIDKHMRTQKRSTPLRVLNRSGRPEKTGTYQRCVVILASASPRRKELLHRCGLKFRIMPSSAPEDTSLVQPVYIVRELALRKALSVARKVKKGVVIGADTIVVLKGEIIGKPAHRKDAERILSKLSGTRHRVYSGIAVVDAATGRTKVSYEVSTVKMRKLSREEIRNASHKHLDKAGAYAVQEKSDAFVEKIEGDYFNVVGLPLENLRKVMKSFNINLGRCQP